MKTIGIDMVQLQVRDWSAAVAWYQEKLGCEVLFREDDHRFCLLKLGDSGAQLALYGRDDVAPGDSRCLPCIRVEGLDAFVAKLKGASVRMQTEIFGGDDNYRMGTILDPEGNAIHVYEWAQ